MFLSVCKGVRIIVVEEVKEKKKRLSLIMGVGEGERVGGVPFLLRALEERVFFCCLLEKKKQQEKRTK